MRINTLQAKDLKMEPVCDDRSEHDLLPGRREFLRAAGISLTAGTIFARQWPAQSATTFCKPESPPLGKVPLLQGMTDCESAQFRVLVNLHLPFSYRFLNETGTELAWQVLDRFVHPSYRIEGIEHLEVHGLNCQENYRLQILDAASGNLLEERFFRAIETDKSNGRFAMISCMNDNYIDEQGEMWRSVAESRPEVIFFIGDACYADKNSDGTEAGLWHRFVDNFKRLDVYRWINLIPIFATWDDHDFGVNNGDSSFHLKDATRVLFNACYGWKAKTDRLVHGPGVASHVRLFNQRFFLMDDRTFRSSARVNSGSQWGSVQEDWLRSAVNKNSEPVWLFNGSQFFGAYHRGDAFERHHAEQLNRVMHQFSRMSAPIVLGSGDVHFSEVMALERDILGYQSFELTSSSLHSRNGRWLHMIERNPRREASTWRHNFLLINSHAIRPGALSLRASSIGVRGQVYFDLTKTIDRLKT